MQSLIQLDQSISTHASDYVAAHTWLANILIVLGVGLVYIVPVILIVVWFGYSRKIALKAAIAGLLAWEGLSKLIAHFVHRARPSLSQIGAKELVFHRPDTSFPSDHSAFIMAVALIFYFAGYKKLGHATLAMAIVVGIARVGIGVHFPGDVLAGWLVGLVVAYLIQLIDQPLDRYILEPVIQFARRLHL